MAAGLRVGSRRHKREGKAISEVMIPALRRAAHYAADKAITIAKTETRTRIRSVGLGRLAGAVSSTSSLKLKRFAGRNLNNAFGAIFARRRKGVTNRGEQALLAYSEGAIIVPTGGKRWLAFPTKAIPQRASNRFKMTPQLYRQSGLETSIGKLHFVPTRKANVALLVAKRVTVSRRTGRAKAGGGRVPRGSDAQKSVVAFVLILMTTRAKRFDQDAIVRRAAYHQGDYAEEYLAKHFAG